MKKVISLIICLFLLPSKAYANINLTLKKGDTLQKISKDYNTSIREIMDLNNIYDADKLKEGQIIKIPKKESEDKDSTTLYKVIPGDNLTKIARIHNTTIAKLIYLNKLDSGSILKPGQILFLPAKSKLGTIKEKKIKFSKPKTNAQYHLVSESENLSKISSIHNISLQQIIELNDLNSSNGIQTGVELLLFPKSLKTYRSSNYGTLKVNWEKVTYLSGSNVISASNKLGRQFHIAINCKSRRINNTIKNKEWRGWYFPKENFEHDLINSMCQQD